MTCLARQIAHSKHQLTSQSSFVLCFLFEMLSVPFKTTLSSYKYEKHSLVSNFCNTSIFNYHFDEQVLCWNHLWASIQSFWKHSSRPRIHHFLFISQSSYIKHFSALTAETSREWGSELLLFQKGNNFIQISEMKVDAAFDLRAGHMLQPQYYLLTGPMSLIAMLYHSRLLTVN